MKSVFNRTIWLYLLIGLVFVMVVNHKRAAYVRGRYLLGIFYNQDLKNFNDGLVYFDYMRHVKPQDARYSFFLGYSYLQLPDLKKARSYFERALDMEPNNTVWKQYLDYTVDQINGGPGKIVEPLGTISIPLEKD
ncbi:MAG: tetratricopeptide repeat protein [Candidatus Omnitrophica bacterium]|nr:tetratricopeptide repeat protein [Candidatus Omnitrophota bacterium]